jgi:predicted nucleic acid-binding protein
MIVLDTGGLYAAIDANESLHGQAVAALVAAKPPRLLSPFVLADLDYLIGQRVGHHAQLALLDEIARGVYRLEVFEDDDVAQAREIMERYADLRIGLADASVVVLAHRHRTSDLLSTDERHFRTLKGPGGRAFSLLPRDAQLKR